jgi:hypothetical protein
MAIPTIDSTQSILGYRAYETFSFMAGGSGSPEILYWLATSLPAGLTLDAPAEKACTGAAATDTISCTAHGFANGDKVFFQSITGGSGLVVPGASAGVYYVRDKGTDSFKLAATPTGAAIDFTTDISAGMIRKCGTSLISGSVATPGVYVFGLKAVNASAGTFPATPSESAVAYFTLGIEAGDGSSVVAGSSDTGIDLNIDVLTREVSLGSGVATGAALFLLKEDDTAILNLRFKKSGTALDPNPTEIHIAFKELETEGVILSAGGVATTDWLKSGTGAAAVFQVPVEVTGDALASALANYEADAGTKFDALCEIEWKQVVAVGGVTELVSSTRTFKVTIERDLVV